MNRQPLWYKDAVFYQLHIKCFKDGNGDGIGDFKGLKEKLGYIQSLGCTAIWLQPFYPSPLLDDGYDIADYMDVHPSYGTLADFKSFLEEAHKRGIKVVTELVINHTSSQHAWFQKSRKAKPNSKWRNYYMWSDTPEKFSDARIIFKDFEHSNWQWDPIAKAYYWHRFYSHQPDLNYDSPFVQKEIFKIVDFWMGLGVDGMRLDAIPYLYAREGTDCENLPETHLYLAKLRAYVDKHYPNRMLLAEANQWPDQAAKYFGNEDECHMAFHFPVMPRLFMALRLEDRFPIVDIMEQTPEIGKSNQWAIFLRNHDELTLEMVTEEERDFMYRTYAKDPKARINLGIRRRLAPLLDNDRAKIELMSALLFSLPGSPIIYYGDEIGMGDNYYLGDRNGVRTPMQWNNDRNGGFSTANPQQLYLPLIIDPLYHHAHLNVENQTNTVNSLLWWMRRTLRIRQKYQAFGRGSLSFLYPKNNKILAFIREHKKQAILVVVNLSRYSQYVELSLKDFVGYTPRDIVSMNAFAPITNEQSYGLTIGGYNHYWLLLENTEAIAQKEEETLIELDLEKSWDAVLSQEEPSHQAFLQALSRYLSTARWFRSKNKTIKEIAIKESLRLSESYLLFLQAVYTNDEEELYLVPVTCLSSTESANLLSYSPQSTIAYLKSKNFEKIIIDATYDMPFRKTLLQTIQKKKTLKGADGSLVFQNFKGFKELAVDYCYESSHLLGGEQSNSSIVYHDKLFLKIFRRLEVGAHPDIELLKCLSEQKELSCVPKIVGSIKWHKGLEETAVGVMQQFIPNSGDMWEYSLNVLRLYQEKILSQQMPAIGLLPEKIDLYSEDPLTEEVSLLIGKSFLDIVAELGSRTAKMHIAFCKSANTRIGAEPFTQFSQKSKYQSMCSRLKRVTEMLKDTAHKLEPSAKDLLEEFLSSKKALLDRYAHFLNTKLNIAKIRIHGDFHLGQVLHTGSGPMIIDFEGEPAIPLTERSLKQIALQDVASMLRSFDYAVQKQLLRNGMQIDNKMPYYKDLWLQSVSKTYLQAYLEKISTSDKLLVPKTKKALTPLLEALLLHKAVYEVSYEIQNRPDWVSVPLAGILNLLGAQT